MKRESNNTGDGDRASINDVARNSGPSRKHNAEEDDQLSENEEEGNGCLNCLGGFFASRQLANENSEYQYLSSSFCELCVYILFLVTITVAVFGLRPSNGYYFHKLITDTFVDAKFDPLGDSATFRTSIDMNDFWKFAETAMLEGLYHSDWKQKKERTFQNGFRKIKIENTYIGRPRLKQVRIHPSPCPIRAINPMSIQPKLRRKLNRISCYLSYKRDKEDNSSLIKSNDKLQAWIEQIVLEEAKGTFYWGRHKTYRGGGLYTLLGTTEDETKQLVHQLKIWQWISRATRAVFLDFIVYNSNINTFAVVRLVWEFQPNGGVTTSWDINSVELERYKTKFDTIILGFEIAFCVFTVYYFLQEMAEICALGVKNYLKDLWSWMDLFILTVSFLCIAYSIYRFIIVRDKLETLFLDPNMFTYLEYFGFWSFHLENAKAICVFLAWIKIFKYVSFNKTMGQISNTISKCYNDLTGLFMLFFIIFFGFVFLGYFLFSHEVRDFRSIVSSIITLLRFTLGDFSFEDLAAANRVLGPVFFFAYALFIIFILMNMFLAIINETYEEVLIEIVEEKKRFRLSHCFRGGFNNICSTLFCRKRKLGRPSHLMPNIKGTISYSEIKDNLLRANFTELEVETFLARHELDEDHIWDENDVRVILNFLEEESYGNGPGDLRRFSQLEEDIADEYPIDDTMTDKDLHELNQRIGSLEHVIFNVEHALNAISTRIDAI